MKPQFFATPDRWRAWLQRHHATKDEVWVGLYKRDSGKPSMTWPESVDAALCFGWIDGVRHSIDDASYMIRFTPRRAGSKWSAVNLRRVAELKRLDLMRPAGLAVHAARRAGDAGYSYEKVTAARKAARLPPAFMRRFKADAAAWKYFSSRPSWYQRTTTWWVISAKKTETRERRLATLIADSAKGRLIGPLKRP